MGEPTVWTKHARLAIEGLIKSGKTPPEIEQIVGIKWDAIKRAMWYHARKEAEERKLAPPPPVIKRPAPTPVFRNTPKLDQMTEDEAQAVAALYRPRAPLPPSLRKYAGRKAFG